jgi:hypothetical protein
MCCPVIVSKEAMDRFHHGENEVAWSRGQLLAGHGTKLREHMSKRLQSIARPTRQDGHDRGAERFYVARNFIH